MKKTRSSLWTTPVPKRRRPLRAAKIDESVTPQQLRKVLAKIKEEHRRQDVRNAKAIEHLLPKRFGTHTSYGPSFDQYLSKRMKNPFFKKQFNQAKTELALSKKLKQIEEAISGKQKEVLKLEALKTKTLQALTLEKSKTAVPPDGIDEWVGNWKYVEGPKKDCTLCQGEGSYESHHNGDDRECGCVKRVWINERPVN